MSSRSLSIVTVLVTVAVLAAGVPAGAQQTRVTAARAGGVDRYATAAIAMEQVAFPSGTDTAIVATGDDFPDALAAAGLAGQADAALLLTQPEDLPQVTATTVIDLGVENVYVLGGEEAVGAGVVEALRSASRDVARVGGASRYETAALVAREVARLGGIRQVGGEPAAFLTTGEGFADALAAGAPAAAGTPAPVLLTERDNVPRTTLDAIDELGIGYLWVVGGEAAVSDDVLRQLQDRGVTVDRIAGRNRLETAAEVARTFVDSGTLAGGVVTLARGDLFPDALVGGVVAAAADGPVLLTASADDLGAPGTTYLAAPPVPVSVVRAMGGQEAITPGVLAQAVAVAAEGNPTAGTDAQVPRPLVEGQDYEIAVTDCSPRASDEPGSRAATGTLTNTTGERRDFRVQVRFDRADAVRLDRASAFVEDLDPGQTAQWRAVSFDPDTAAETVTCGLDGVREPPAGDGFPSPDLTVRYATIDNTAEGGGDAGDIDAVTYICYVYHAYAPVTCGDVSN